MFLNLDEEKDNSSGLGSQVRDKAGPGPFSGLEQEASITDPLLAQPNSEAHFVSSLFPNQRDRESGRAIAVTGCRRWPWSGDARSTDEYALRRSLHGAGWNTGSGPRAHPLPSAPKVNRPETCGSDELAAIYLYLITELAAFIPSLFIRPYRSVPEDLS